VALLWVALLGPGVATLAGQAPEGVSSIETAQSLFDQYCMTCHSEGSQTAGLNLEALDLARPDASAEVLEKVIARLRAESMPPPGMPRPGPETSRSMAEWLEGELDRAWRADPDPGRIAALHRLNRTEYNNAIRDLFALDLDVRPLLPGDETADGSFDNFAGSLSISTAHLERYLSVARQVTGLATGLPPASPTVETFEVPLHLLQEDRQSEALPLGSRGGIAVSHQFPVDGEYRIDVRLQRQYQDYLKGMGWPQQLEIRLDGRLLRRFEVGGQAQGRPAADSYAGGGEVGFAGDPEWEEYMQLTGDRGLSVTLPVEAGPHVVGVSFVRELWAPEGLPQPVQRGRVIGNDQVYMGYANVASVEIGGPFAPGRTSEEAPGGRTPSRPALFTCHPDAGGEAAACAREILGRMARSAYRRPVTTEDIDTLFGFYEESRRGGGSFEAGIQFGLERMLMDPDFLLRIYRDPESAGESVYPLSPYELASRLSFFLWSSIPDERLLDLAETGTLDDPAILESEVRRMLADPRALDALVGDFAAQWLNLRRVPEVVVDPGIYPNYDLSLMEGFRQETELFLESTILEDRSVLELVDADYTFLNERLARHYGIPGVYGSRFRRVALIDREQRGGLLAQGAILATTSYPDRTSPVLRGKWLLDNILALPVPPPPEEVDTTLEEDATGALPTSIRERLARHRENPSCNNCHSVIDPLGFALENFDVIGGWRTHDERGNAVDSHGQTSGGARIDGLAGLRTLLLEDPERFPRTVTSKLLTYALGRRLEYYDQPAVRQIVRDASDEEYRWSSLILGIVESVPFRMRARPGDDPGLPEE
jgi:mono/diheme cytochrome c family protein